MDLVKCRSENRLLRHQAARDPGIPIFPLKCAQSARDEITMCRQFAKEQCLRSRRYRLFGHRNDHAPPRLNGFRTDGKLNFRVT